MAFIDSEEDALRQERAKNNARRARYKARQPGARNRWQVRWALSGNSIQDTAALGATIARGFREGA